MAYLLSDVVEMAEAAQKYRKEHPEDFNGARTFIEKIDCILKNGIIFPFYGVIVAAHKAGKTAMMLTLMLAYLRQDYAVLFITLEMTLWQMIVRVLSNDSMTDMNVLDGMEDTEDDWVRIRETITWLKGKLGFIAYGARTPQAIADEIKDVQRKLREKAEQYIDSDPAQYEALLHKKLLVILDYGQLVDLGNSKSEYEGQTKLSHWLRAISQGEAPQTNGVLDLEGLLGVSRSSVAILTALQVAKGDKRSKARISSSSARGTGAWEEDADLNIVIDTVLDKNAKPFPDLRHIELSGRFTGGGEAVLHFERAQARFQDPTVDEEEEAMEPVVF